MSQCYHNTQSKDKEWKYSPHNDKSPASSKCSGVANPTDPRVRRITGGECVNVGATSRESRLGARSTGRCPPRGVGKVDQRCSEMESWTGLKQEITKMFNHRISFCTAMQKIETRKWNCFKESFDQYAIDKLALIHRLNLPTPNVINLLVRGIMKSSFRATALTLSTDSLDQFLERMKQITEGIGELEKRSAIQHKMNKAELTCKNCRKDHHQRECREEVCFYCKGKRHRIVDCPKRKRRKNSTAHRAVEFSHVPINRNQAAKLSIAVAVEPSEELQIRNPIVRVISVESKSCNSNALIDTGSPISFISVNSFYKHINSSLKILEPEYKRFNALSSVPIYILGKYQTCIQLGEFSNIEMKITLHVVSNDFAEFELIIGRDFLEEQQVTLIYRPCAKEIDNSMQLLLPTESCYTTNSVESVIDDINIDFEWSVKKQLKKLILDCENSDVPLGR